MSDKIVRPGLRKKLKTQQRLKLFHHAAEKFIDAELRAKEDAAEAALLEALHKDYRDNLEPALSTIEKFVHCGQPTGLYVAPVPVAADIKEKTYTLPNGETVVRKERDFNWVEPGAKRGYEFVDNNIVYLRQFVAGGSTGYSRPRANLLDIEALDIRIPNHNGHNKDPRYNALAVRAEGHGRTVTWGIVGHCSAIWLTDRFKDAMTAYVKATRARQEAEDELMKAIGAVILSAEYFADVVAIWPEANELLDTLFPVDETLRPNMSLVALNDDQKALLCSAMKKRGVDSTLCAAA